eukprot:COSAG06_NODE_33579_length_487_cov_1.708191_2_plen_88_part_01
MQAWEEQQKEKNQRARELIEARQAAQMHQRNIDGLDEVQQTIEVLPARRIQHPEEQPLSMPEEDWSASSPAPSVLAVRRIVDAEADMA